MKVNKTAQTASGRNCADKQTSLSQSLGKKSASISAKRARNVAHSSTNYGKNYTNKRASREGKYIANISHSFDTNAGAKAQRQGASSMSGVAKVAALLAVILCMLAATLSFSSCSLNNNTPKLGAFFDDSGAEIVLDSPPQKIISLVPAITELLFTVGEGDRIVAVSDYCDYPADKIKNLPRFGFGADLSVEALLIYDCDTLIITKMAHEESHANTLKAAGITVIVLEARSISDIKRHITILSGIFGKESLGKNLNNDLQRGLDDIAALLDGKGMVTAYLEISPLEATLFTMNNSTFLGEILSLCNIENVFAGEADAWAMISEESVIFTNPQYIIKMYTDEEYSYAGDIKSIANRAGWDSIAAVENGNIIEVDSILYSRATNRIVDVAKDLALKIHGVSA